MLRLCKTGAGASAGNFTMFSLGHSLKITLPYFGSWLSPDSKSREGKSKDLALLGNPDF